MAQGLFTLKQQLQGLIQKAWSNPSTYAGSFPTGSLSQYLQATLPATLSGQFTIEFWYYRNTTGNSSYFTLGDVNTSTGLEFYIGTGGTLNQLYTNNATLLQNTSTNPYVWTYVAITRDASNVIRMFINGTSNGTTATNSNAFSSTLRLGVEYYNGAIDGGCNGLLSNFRILNGTCLYTSNFTPSSSPLSNITNTAILTLQNSTIVDNSSNALSITNNGSVTTQQAFPFTGNSSYATPAVEYLVVAGGGGGGSNDGSGGGAGGLLQGISNVTAGVSVTVTVGSGGAGATPSGTGTSGNNSVFANITSIGGGGGSSWNSSTPTNGLAGGSGGGGGLNDSGSISAVGQGTANQGNAGGTGYAGGGNAGMGGGGGGAGTVGLNARSLVPGNGGAGVASAISGTVTTYAGGGGGSPSASSSTFGIGGVGGGGTGNNTAAGGSGTTNTGGGGGGGGFNGTVWGGGTGGSGIVIISYPDTYNAPSALTGTYTASTSGSGSMNFNGSSNKVTYASSSAMSLSGQFTIECWVYWNGSSPPYQNIIGSNDTFSNNASFIRVWGTSALSALASKVGIGNVSHDSTSAVYSTNNLIANTWNHIAATRDSSNIIRLFINGFLEKTGTTDTSLYDFGQGGTCVGDSPWDGANGWYSGYITNLRIIKGTCLYTSSFTPSTIPLTSISGTSLLLNSVSGAYLQDSSPNSFSPTSSISVSAPWSQLSPFATGLGYKNRVYTWTGSGTVTF